MAAAAAAAAVSGTAAPAQMQNNIESLLDIDFDGTAPASAQKEPPSGMSGLEGLAGTPVRVQSPASGVPPPTSNNLEDLMGVFGSGPDASVSSTGGMGPQNGGSNADLMNGFAGLDLTGSTSRPTPPPASGTTTTKSNQDILDLF